MNLLGCRKNLAPPYLALPLQEVAPVVLINTKLRAPDAYARQDVQNEGQELNIIHRPRQTKMAEMSRALVICLPTTPAFLAIVDYTHSRIEQPADLRFIPLVGSCISDFYHRALFNLIGTEHAKLNANDWFDF
jgi:hypothetical protein